MSSEEIVRYLDSGKNEREYVFDNDVYRIDLVGNSSGPGYKLIGQTPDEKVNDVLDGVFDVLNEEKHPGIEVPRTEDGTSMAIDIHL